MAAKWKDRHSSPRVGGTINTISFDITEAMKEDLQKSLTVAGIEIYREIVKNKLSNGGYLGVQSGTLRRSVRWRVFEEKDNSYGLVIGSNVWYFAAYETGNHDLYREKLTTYHNNIMHKSMAARQWHGKKHRPFVSDTVNEYFHLDKFKLTD